MRKILIFNLFLVLLMAAGCNRDSVTTEWTPAIKPEVTTYPVARLYKDAALLHGEYSAKSTSIAGKGFFVSTDENFPADATSVHEVEGLNSGEFTYMFEDPALTQKYYVKAYVRHPSGDYVFGSVQWFYAADLAIEPADAPQTEAAALNFHCLKVDVTVPNIGTSNVFGLDLGHIKPSLIGVRYWKEGQTEADALETCISESESNTKKEGDLVSFTIDNLIDNTTYHYCAFIEVGIYSFLSSPNFYMPVVAGEVDQFTMPDIPMPEVTSKPATNVAANGVTLNGILNSDGADPNVVYGFYYGKTSGTLDLWAEATSRNTDNTYSVNVMGIDHSSTYYFAAYVRNGKGEIFGTELNFLTQTINAPVVTSSAATAVSAASATLHGTMTSNGNDATATWGFYLGTGSTLAELMASGTKHQVMTMGTSNDFTWTSTGLNFNTVYYFVAYVLNMNSEVQSAPVLSFTTPDIRPVELNADTMNRSGSVTGIDYNYRFKYSISASTTLTAQVTEGIHNSLTYGFKWGTTPGALVNDLPGSNINPETGYFSVELTGMSPNADYYVQAYANNAKNVPATTLVAKLRPAVNGGNQLLYDFDQVGGDLFSKMKPTGEPLTYIELEPITTTAGTIYLLDRNLGATAPFTSQNYNVLFGPEKPAVAGSGYYYQWGQPIPSAVYNSVYGSGINAPWITVAANIPTVNWADSNDPCRGSPGYRLLTLTEWNAINTAFLAEKGSALTFLNWYERFRIGVTNHRTGTGSMNSQANGGMQFWSWTSVFAGSATGNRVTINSSTNAFAVGGQNSMAGFPIRCARVE